MQNIILHNVQYNSLDAMTWCATADVCSILQPILWSYLSSQATPLTPYTLHTCIDLCDRHWHCVYNQSTLSPRETARIKRQQQRSGVRLLLQNLLHKLNIADTLDDSKYPYQLVKHRYYVCFSHSDNQQLNAASLSSKVAVIVGRKHAVGIDIEIQEVAWSVIKRFYHVDEINILMTLTPEQRAMVAKILWQIKESFIKIHQYKLAQGLGINYATLIASLTSKVISDNYLVEIKDKSRDYQINYLPSQQTVVIF